MLNFHMCGGQGLSIRMDGAAEKRDGDTAGHSGEPIYE